MLSFFRTAYRLILPGFRPGFYAIVLASIFVGLLEMLGVASVMPFIAIMINPSALARNQVAGKVLAAAGFGGQVPPVHVIGLITIGLFVLANVTSLALTWWSARYAADLAVAQSERYAESIFHRPFAFFAVHPPADLANQMCNEVIRTATGYVLQLCNVLVRAIQLVMVLALLLLLSPQFTLAFAAVTAAVYLLIYRFSSLHMAREGVVALDASAQSISAATEMYGMAREILLRRNPRYFVRRVCVELDKFYRAEAISRILPTVPKYAVEITALCAIFALPIYRSYMGQDVQSELPLLATFTYAGFRLLPVIQQAYASLTVIRFYEPMAQRIEQSLDFAAERADAGITLAHMPARIELKEVGYRYPSGNAPAISRISLAIARGERVAIVGASGAGKSTLVDVILGLLPPNEGAVLIDGAPVGPGGLAWWMGVVGYVPQSPLISSDTIAGNIAFGSDEDEIDPVRCREAASRAGIIDVIDAHPAGLDAVIGAEGFNLSGGERQRLALARAFYSRPELLVLDEPGSNLDPPASRKIFELLCSRTLEATVIAITHDVEHLGLFDKIVFMRKGAVVMAGPYAALVRDSAEFRAFQGDLLHGKLPA